MRMWLHLVVWVSFFSICACHSPETSSDSLPSDSSRQPPGTIDFGAQPEEVPTLCAQGSPECNEEETQPPPPDMAPSGRCDESCSALHGTATCENNDCVITCEPGWHGALCDSDINECAHDPNPCDVNAACINTDGSFQCACDAGYQGDGTSCTNMDECTNGAPNYNEKATKHTSR